MKKLIALIAMAFAANVFAYTETVGDYTWYYSNEYSYGGVEIYRATETKAVSPEPTGNIVVPSTLGGKPVTRIGYSAFYNCTSLTGVTIPDSVKAIDYEAFKGCTYLRSINIPDGLTRFGDNAFSGCLSLTRITIPNGVTTISTGCFENSGINSITIPNSVTVIGANAFKNAHLSSLTIPNSVKIIGDYAFAYNNISGRLTIPDSVTDIGEFAFQRCSHITSVSIGSGVSRMGGGAFSECNYLSFDTSTIPGVYMLDGWVLGCDTSISGTVDLRGVRGVCDAAFVYCYRLTGVILPDGMTRIGDHLFLDCKALKQVDIPDSVTEIGDYAFKGCSSLNQLTLPDGLRKVSDNSFTGCPAYEVNRVLAAVNYRNPRYELTTSQADRAIASVTVTGDTALDSFVLSDGKVYDTVLYVTNSSSSDATVTLPGGYEYVTFSGAEPLRIPAGSRNMLTITRIDGTTFLVSRQTLQTIGQ